MSFNKHVLKLYNAIDLQELKMFHWISSLFRMDIVYLIMAACN
jgi:hypothetical protein